MDRKGSYSAGDAGRKRADAGRGGLGDAMEIMIWIGAALALAGVAGLVWCGRLAMQARHMADEAARAAMQRVVTLNLAAMGLSVLGLMLVVAGLFLR